MQRMEDDDASDEALRDAECPETTVEALSRALLWRIDFDVDDWSRQVLHEASPILHERARRLWRRQMVILLAAAAGVLPLALGLGAYGISTAYGLLSVWLPAPIATYLVATYAALAVAALGAVYAMIPIAIDRSRDRLEFAHVWEGAR